MKKILLLACEGIQQRTSDDLAAMFRMNNFEVDYTSAIEEKRENAYNLAVIFGRDEYAKIHSIYPELPIYCVDKESMVLSLYVDEARGNTSNNSVPTILLGTDDFHSLLRAVVLLNISPDWRVNLLYSGSHDIGGTLHSHMCVYEENEAEKLVESADLIIGCGNLAFQGTVCRKPVIVLGNYGLGGLITPKNVYEQCQNNFYGRINGNEGEYFSLGDLKSEIEKGFESDLMDLDYISACVKSEIKVQRDKLLQNIISLCN